MNDNFNDPIVALATGTGNSGIGIIRLSGKDEIIQEIAKLVLPKFKPENRKAQLLSFVDHKSTKSSLFILRRQILTPEKQFLKSSLMVDKFFLRGFLRSF